MKIINKILIFLLFSLFIFSSVSAAALMKVGSTGDNVTNLQADLKSAGYYNFYKTTGYYGPITKDAVLRFQKDNGLNPDGIADEDTINMLYRYNNTILQFGIRSQKVSHLQSQLKDLGYFNFYKITDYYGHITENSVIDFQKSYGLTIDGIAGPQTMGKLNSLSANTSSESSSDLYWLSRIIEAESSGESYNGKVAVGNVVLNRVKSPLFPNTIKTVIFQYYKGIPMFSPVENGTIYNTPGSESIKAAKAVLNGSNVVGNATYFLNPTKAKSTWIENNKNYVCQIGDHVFYV